MQVQYTEDQIHEHSQILQLLPIAVFIELTEDQQVATVERAAKLISEVNFLRQHSKQIVNLLQGLAVAGVGHDRVKGQICDYLESWESLPYAS